MLSINRLKRNTLFLQKSGKHGFLSCPTFVATFSRPQKAPCFTNKELVYNRLNKVDAGFHELVVHIPFG